MPTRMRPASSLRDARLEQPDTTNTSIKHKTIIFLIASFSPREIRLTIYHAPGFLPNHQTNPTMAVFCSFFSSPARRRAHFRARQSRLRGQRGQAWIEHRDHAATFDASVIIEIRGHVFARLDREKQRLRLEAVEIFALLHAVHQPVAEIDFAGEI